MKMNSLTVPASVYREAVQEKKVSNPFTMAKAHAFALRIKAKLPEGFQDVLVVETEKDLKITLCLLAVCAALLLPSVLLYIMVVTPLAFVSRTFGKGKEARNER